MRKITCGRSGYPKKKAKPSLLFWLFFVFCFDALTFVVLFLKAVRGGLWVFVFWVVFFGLAFGLGSSWGVKRYEKTGKDMGRWEKVHPACR